jgi:hypothetical protein
MLISSNFTTLLERLHKLVQQQSISLAPMNAPTTIGLLNRRLIESDVLTTTICNISQTIEATTRSEYEFINLCKRFLDYQAPREILLSTPGDKVEHGYWVPISQTLSSIFRRQEILSVIVDNVARQRQATKDEDDLLFSFRDCYDLPSG